MWSELFSISVESHGVAAVHDHASTEWDGKRGLIQSPDGGPLVTFESGKRRKA